VLWNQWRLVNNSELFDVASDPAQQRDLAAKHPDVVSAMQRHYDSWWDGVAGRVNEFSRITIGADAENPTLLSACEWADVFLDQMAQVRRGERKNGVWHLEVERDGTYEFTLRRWPEEADLPLAAPSPEIRVTDGVLPAGIGLPIGRVRLKIGGREAAAMVGPQDKAVTFTRKLSRGPAELETWFYDHSGAELCGAYFVTVRRH
jgi:hypothetical protein